MTARADETWHRLRDWTTGSGSAERLAGQLLQAEGYWGFDPSHPLGGPDGTKDGIAHKDGGTYVLAAYFPKGQQSFAEMEKKFRSDLAGVAKHNGDGLAFVTNQELTLGQRATLAAMTNVPLDLFHLERVMAVLDRPDMRPVRDRHLGVYGDPPVTSGEVATVAARLEALQTGGDTFCYWMLYNFDLARNVAHDFCIIRRGEYPLYDIRVRIVDMDSPAKNVFNEAWGEMSAPAEYRQGHYALKSDCYFRVFFHARNGQWHQDLQLKRSEQAQCWLAATRVIGMNGRDELFRKIDDEFVGEFGEPVWRE